MPAGRLAKGATAAKSGRYFSLGGSVALSVVAAHDFVSGSQQTNGRIVLAVDEKLLKCGFEFGEVDGGRVVVLGVVAFEPEHDVGHLVDGTGRKIGASNGRHVDHLSLDWARGEKGCGDRSISKLH